MLLRTYLPNISDLDAERLADAVGDLGDGHPETIRAMGNLAADLREPGEVERARELEQTVAGRRGERGEGPTRPTRADDRWRCLSVPANLRSR